MGPIILNLGPHGIDQGSLRAYKLKFGAPCYQSKFIRANIERFGPLIALGAIHGLEFKPLVFGPPLGWTEFENFFQPW